MACRSTLRLAFHMRTINRSQNLRPLSTRSAPPLLNEALKRLPSVRLISETGDDLGLMSGLAALSHARKCKRDIMQVSASETPAVRILDYAAFMEARRKKAYDQRKVRKESLLLQRKEAAVKQIRLSPATDVHDRAMKMRQASDFLKAGYGVKVYMQFRRGQGRLKEKAKLALVEAGKELGEYGTVLGVPPGGTVEDLFRVPAHVEGEDEPEVRKPLQIVLRPFSRKLREKIWQGKMDGEGITENGK